MQKLILIFFLLLAGCNEGIICSKYCIPGQKTKLIDTSRRYERIRVDPDTYIIEFKCNKCNGYHQCIVSKNYYDKKNIGEIYP